MFLHRVVVAADADAAVAAPVRGDAVQDEPGPGQQHAGAPGAAAGDDRLRPGAVVETVIGAPDRPDSARVKPLPNVPPRRRSTRVPGANVAAVTLARLFHAVAAEVPGRASLPDAAST